ncbi:MAG: VOC family protein [Aquihabitans sp.]
MGLTAKNPFENDERFRTTTSGEPGTEPEPDEGGYEDDRVPVELNRVHHVAIAVEDLDEAIDEYRVGFGVTVESRERLVEEDVEVALLRVGDSLIQLMAATDDECWLIEFLDGQASALNHVGFEVDDIAVAMAALEAGGYEMVDEGPRQGPASSRIAYVHPPDQPGTLIQLVEPG